MDMVKAKGKKVFREMVAKMPPFFKKTLTKIKVWELTRHLMSEEEVILCESNPTLRDKIVERYKKKYPKQVKMINIQINDLFPQYTKYKNLPPSGQAEMIRDAEFCWFAYGFIIYEYVFLDFAGENNTPEKRRTFVSDAERGSFRFCANDFTDTSYADKIKAYEILKPFYKRDMLIVQNESDYNAFKTFSKNHPGFVLKEMLGSRGNGVSLVNTDFIGKDYFHTIINRGGYFWRKLSSRARNLPDLIQIPSIL